MVQWTISSDERRELERAAGPRRDVRRSRFAGFTGCLQHATTCGSWSF